MSLPFTAMASTSYDDPLLPWLRSIRQVKQAYPEDKSKLLPHVSDCYREFCEGERYRNDPRFLRICVQLADCSPESLKIMTELDERGIGHDHALFYEAYATCLEAKRRFGDANIVYKRGLSRQAQPAEKLANSYKLFRDRMDIRKKRKQDQLEQHARNNCDMVEEGMHGSKHRDFIDNGLKQMEACQGDAERASKSHLLSTSWYTAEGLDVSFEELRLATVEKKVSYAEEQCDVMETKHISLSNHYIGQNTSVSNRIPITSSFGEETIQIRNFAAEAITGKEKDVEDARHHGLVDPTINTKEALQDILSMFCKPLDIGKKKDTGKSSKRQGFVSLSVAPSSPMLRVNKRQMISPKGGLQTQPLELSVFKDEEEYSQVKTKGKPADMSPLPLDRQRQTKPPLGGFQAQPLFKDGEQEQSHIESWSKTAPLSPSVHESKRQRSISPRGGLQARPSEFSVFRDDELDEARSKPAVKAGNPGKVADNLPWVAKPEQRAEECGFFVFKDEEFSEEETEHALNVYRDGEKSECKPQCSALVESKLMESELFVFRDEPCRGSLQERKSGLLSHNSERKMSKGKSLGVNKMLACGIENLLPQSPVHQP